MSPKRSTFRNEGWLHRDRQGRRNKDHGSGSKHCSPHHLRARRNCRGHPGALCRPDI